MALISALKSNHETSIVRVVSDRSIGSSSVRSEDGLRGQRQGSQIVLLFGKRRQVRL
jgi:hypothetical protein